LRCPANGGFFSCAGRGPQRPKGDTPTRPFLLAGTSLLALFVPVAIASATNVTYINSSPAVDGQQVPTGFVQGDVLVNPDGLFNGVLQGDGNFVVHYGTNPDQPVDWASGHGNGSAGAPYGLGTYRGNTKLFGTSLTSFYVYQNNNPASSSYELEGSNYYNAPTFLSLNDNGTLSIYPGTNGVATGAAITTIATNLKELDLTEDVHYDFSKAVISNEAPVAGATVQKSNDTPTQETTTVSLSLTHTDTQMFSWSESHAVAVSIQSKVKISAPGIEAETTVGVTDTTTIMNGESTSASDTTTFSVSDQLTVPAFSTYADEIVAVTGTETVPYTFSGTAVFDNGQTGIVSGSGVFSGLSTGGFEIETTCVSSPTNCKGVAPIFTPLPIGATTVPEPATWAMMLIGFAGSALPAIARLAEPL
jgi:hypothetical protein